ncbi:type III-B CRISPR-associated protein Cas10/Cmr2 [Pelagibius sp. CAU 1746]|uniref:Cas10/Cmr2 second palm domain-containing protein n=1 Tax=Pelagibius sp. CAU 1746 TaxID=3140370 RepID=UPI00325C14D9
MTDRKELLHFSLSPVQGFIADARRTRDLWAGSFLLSWLSGQAMAALVEKQGEIIFPSVDGDELFEAVSTAQAGAAPSATPFVGSLPNRFKANVERVDGDPGEICKGAVRAAWQRLEAAVYDQFVAEAAESHGNNTQDIWDRQVNGFWDMTWVTGADPGDSSDGSWLDRRKNWRSHYGGRAAAEPGDLCRLMGHLQEISGYQRIGKEERERQNAFWQAMASAKGIGALDLKADERLCAIALIKRLFPRLATIEAVIGWKPGGAGMDIVHWPSVSYIAAVPWLKAVEKKLSGGEQSEFWMQAQQYVTEDFMGEAATKDFGLPSNGLFKLDGHLLHQDGIAAWPLEDFAGTDDNQRRASRAHLADGLKQVQSRVGNGTRVAASEFYALLQMDGDRIGSALRLHQDVVRDGLDRFTKAVKRYFGRPNESNGVLIYAGGDDVSVFLPLDTALQAAQSLHGIYSEAFAEAIKQSTGTKADPADFTMSAAIVLAQYKIPLRRVVSHAHTILDDVAKAQNGRDSLAISILKPGGESFGWVSAWSGTAGSPVEVMAELAMTLNVQRHIPSRLFHNLKTRYLPLFEETEDRADGDPADALRKPEVVRSLVQAELVASQIKDGFREEVREQLLTIGRPLVRKHEGTVPTDGFDFDGGLVTHFFSVEGRWRLLGEGEGD